MQFAAGYKTYACAAIAAIVGIDQGLIAAGVHGIPAIPGWVIFALTAVGLYSARSGTTTDVAKATADIARQVLPPAPPAVAAAAPSRTMTAKANGTPYAAFIKAGWTDDELTANGYMNSTTD
jgi:hypothetical protein